PRAEPSGAERTSRIERAPAADDGGQTTPVPPRSSGEPAPASAPASDSQRRSTAVAPKSSKKASEYEAMIGRTLGGYRIEKLLGAGGMGAVFLAQQTSLDRKVALKILPARFASSPELLARFTREALSAGHLNHHNIMQVYDVGADDGTHYISMEFVRGENLGDLIRRDGPMRVDDAAGTILQACRGLHYAHKRGIIHRDIKPDNIMVNEHGVVKIADLGLAKMTGHSIGEEERREYSESEQKKAIVEGELTQANVAFGTPAYMAPEQSRDTAGVDSRADQYSLGCTLYYMCAGKAPYAGTTVFELLSKHREAPLTPLDAHVRGVPPAFSRIIEKMLAKKPEDRYESLEDVAKDLEHYLGLDHDGGQYKPRDQHLAILEESVKEFYALAALKRRRLATTAFWILMPLLVVLSFVTTSIELIGASIGLLVLVPFFCFLVDGIMGRTYLFRRARGTFFGMPWKAWLKVVGSIAGVTLFLVLTGWYKSWLAVAAGALGIAVGRQFLLLRPLAAQKAPVIDRMREMLKELRVRGVSEEALQDFVCRFSGTQWEEFFEEFFSIEDKVLARNKTASQEKVAARKKFATWREPLLRWFDKIEEERRAARERKTLTDVEAGRLQAEGLDAGEARKMAELEATRIIETEFAELDKEEIITPRRRLPIGKLLRGFFRMARPVVGLVMIGYGVVLLCLLYNLPVPEVLKDFYVKTLKYQELGLQPEVLAYLLSAIMNVLMGLALVILTFSSRVVAPLLTLAGALLFVFATPIINFAQQPLLQPGIVLIVSVVLAILRTGYCFLSKFTGGHL
ncbi:MAG: protein kinase, partial [Candidatus Sumerlaeia bacterium]|nr:protein kinase [Candidatus Sumerlaeia bacterium]